MKVMVTGGTGFVGSNIIDVLEKALEPSEIMMFVRDVQKANDRAENGVNIFQGDLTDFNSIKSAVNEFMPEIVIHTAALADDWASLSKLMEINAEGTKRIVEAMINSKTANFLIHISSSGVYPRREDIYISENSSYGPYGNYHKSKLAAEQIVLEAFKRRNINGTVIRPPNIMGVRDFTHMAKICQTIKNHKFPLIRGGKARQTWVAAEDLASAVLLIISNQEKANGKIYNVKSFEITVKDLYEQIATILKVTEKPKNYPYIVAYPFGVLSEIFGKIKGKPSRFNRYRVIKFAKDRLFDDSKIREELGYKPQATAEATIKKTVEWLIKEEII
jgi:nucleoside-diphosphate-sugar epimerase